ncbi:MAG: phenylalanine--tRNA ligase subunit alpha [Thermoprotei archaeon]|nr:MAG: phenylalanine--tRNA ligase subunit alpha [Thermoprotei archaeon]RLF22761.1 MAG: phenylalanine--tRNA ligase subunit alpha [Thermoprotei archaeon]
MKTTSLELSEGEVKVLRCLKEAGKSLDVEEISRLTGLTLSSVMSYVESLHLKGMVSLKVVEEDYVELTDEGKRYAFEGLPERRLLNALRVTGRRALRDVKSIEGLREEEVALALGWLRRKNWGRIVEVNGERFIEVFEAPKSELEEYLERMARTPRAEMKTIPKAVLEEMKARRLVNIVSIKRRSVSITDLGLSALEEAAGLKVISVLTSDIIKSGKWRTAYLRPYNVTAEPPKVYPGRRHFYSVFLEKVKRILVEMGFIEAEGPYVELEFWNFDVLFQAQDHPAREIHDCFLLLNPSRGELPSSDIVERVKEVHERVWGYKWSRDQASRLILRSHTTAVSARFLAKRPKPPVKMFCVSKVFRPDVIDATHFIEFTQVEGIYGEPGVNLRTLLGILQDFAQRLGFKEVRFRPSYFPFTEPSVEGSVYHPQLGWIECLGAGMFRPEVLKSLGIDYPVAAWGIGIDRLAMVLLGISDIRNLCSRDLKFLRERVEVI